MLSQLEGQSEGMTFTFHFLMALIMEDVLTYLLLVKMYAVQELGVMML